MAATSSASSGRKNGIGGFVVDKIDEAVMLAYIKEKDIAEDMGGINDEMTAEQVGVSLALYLKEKVPTGKQAKCDKCQGISNRDDPHCPFCGDTGEVIDEPAPAKPSKASKSSKGDDKGAEDGEDDEEAAAEDAAREEHDAQLAAEAAAEDEEDEEEDEEPAVQAASAPASETKKKSTKKGTKNMSTATVVNGSSKKGGKSTALAKGTTGTAVSARDLDKARDEVIEIRSRGMSDYWEMGTKLAEINKKQLWKLRVNPETGKNQYNGFDAFVIAELQMTPMSAYRAIGVAENYTKSEAHALGKTKAALILQAAPEDRKKLAAAAKKGASKRVIEKGVKKSREKHGSPKKSQQAKAGAKGGAKKAKATASRSEKISIVALEGSRTIKLHKKPETFKDVVFSKLPRAAKLGDQPVGRYEMANGLVQYFAVRNSEEGLVLKIETRREASE